jgi:hypothetical protein
MKTNEGLIDRIVRILIGSISLVVGYFWLECRKLFVDYWAAMSLTGLVGFVDCIHYSKINTCSRNEKPLSLMQLGLVVAILE